MTYYSMCSVDKRLIMKKIFIVLLGAMLCGTLRAQYPPITPAWALGHIVWEDSLNTEYGAQQIVGEYFKHDIPVNAVIIDSPWSTAYNNFEWDSSRYPDYTQMIDDFSKKNVKVILWLTGVVNNKSKDTKLQKSTNFDEAVSRKLGINHSVPATWWKGEGVHIDFTNSNAVEWWSHQLDKVFKDGIYGWKVDQGEFWFGDMVETSIGKMSNELFRPYYYDAMYDYTVRRNPNAIIIARPYSHQGGFAASVEKMSLGWCGDFSGDWSGLKLQIQNIYKSSQRGYGAVGCEVAGFSGAKASKESFVRYAQFGSMTACMINGGENGAFSNHLPWWYGKEVEEIYRNCVKLHNRLIPYLFSTLIDSHLYGGSLIKNTSLNEESHQLGDYLFTKVVTSEGGNVSFHLPSEGEWIDFFSGQKYKAGEVVCRIYSLNEFPLFVKAGAIIPVQTEKYMEGRVEERNLDNGKTILLYPNGVSCRNLHLPCGDGVEYEDYSVLYDDVKGRLNVRGKRNELFTFVIKNVEGVVENVENSLGWKFDKANKELIIYAESNGDGIEILKRRNE